MGEHNYRVARLDVAGDVRSMTIRERCYTTIRLHDGNDAPGWYHQEAAQFGLDVVRVKLPH